MANISILYSINQSVNQSVNQLTNHKLASVLNQASFCDTEVNKIRQKFKET